MEKKILVSIYSLVFVIFISIAVSSQVADPQVPRSWWNSVRDYIRSKSESKIMSFVLYDEPTDQVIGVFTPQNSITVQRIDVYARAKVDSDSTAFVMTDGINSAVVLLDSFSSANQWFNSTEVTFERLSPCTLKFSDNDYSGTFVSGADTPMVVVQYKIAD